MRKPAQIDLPKTIPPDLYATMRDMRDWMDWAQGRIDSLERTVANLGKNTR